MSHSVAAGEQVSLDAVVKKFTSLLSATPYKVFYFNTWT